MDYCRPGSPAHGILGFLRRAYWSRSPFPSWGDLPNPRMAAVSPSLTGGSFITFTTEPSHSYYVVISRTSLFLFQIKCSSSFAYYWHFAEHIHFLRVKWNTKQFQLLTLLNLFKRYVSNNFIKVNAAYFTSRKQLKSLKIKAKIKNIWFGVFALDRVNLYINYT